MPADYSTAFAALRTILANHANKLSVKEDKPKEYTLVTKSPSPFPQQKNGPLFFGSVRLGKAYASFHLFPLYVDPELANGMSPELKKRMQGKSCFKLQDATGSRRVGRPGAADCRGSPGVGAQEVALNGR